MSGHGRHLLPLVVVLGCSSSTAVEHGAPSEGMAGAGGQGAAAEAALPRAGAWSLGGAGGIPGRPPPPSGGARVDDRVGGALQGANRGGRDAGAPPVGTGSSAPPVGTGSSSPPVTDASTGHPPPAADASTSTPPLPAACAPRADLLAVPGAGNGTISGCPARVCSGVDRGTEYPLTPATDLSRYVGCTAVTGSLVVTGYTGTDLTLLKCLERVDGDMVVWYSPGLVTMHGLESLTQVGGQLGVGYNRQLFANSEKLTGFDGLSGLRAVGGDVDISGGDALASLAGLESLVAIGGHLTLENEGATHPMAFSGLNALQWVGGDLVIWDTVRVTNVTGLRVLRSVGGNFIVGGTNGLTEIVTSPSFACIRGSIVLDTMWTMGNANLSRIAMPGLRYVGGDIIIESQPALQQISLLDAVETVAGGVIRIDGNPKLTTLPVSALGFHVGSVVVTNDPLLDACPLRTLVQRLIVNGWTGPADFTGTPTCP